MKPHLAAPTLSAPQPGAHLLDAMARQAREFPQHAAIVSAERTLDYATLHRHVQRCAAALAARGVQPDDLVAIDAARSAQNLTLLLAVLHRGAAYLPLDSTLPLLRREQMLTDAQPQWMFIERRGATSAGGVSGCDIDELFADETTGIVAAPTVGELGYVLFTSGSTGRPKGVAMRHSPLTHLIDWHVRHARLGKAARTLQFAPLSFDVSFQEILSTLATGGTLILPSDAQRRDPWALLELIREQRIERIFLPYVALQALADAAVPEHMTMLASLRDVITAGEQLRITPALRAVFSALPACVLHNHYGPTEAHVVSAHELAGDPAQWPELPSIGRALPHVRLDVVDAGLRSLPAGNEGELLIGGDCLARGYVHRPDLTAERFIERNGARFYRTGDRACADAHGELAYLGRLDDQIKLAGFRIEPAEIENVLLRHPGVVEAVVVLDESESGKRLAAHVVPRDLHASEADMAAMLRQHCATQLADYLVPHTFLLHAALPLTASGKIDRRALARRDAMPAVRWDDALPLEQQLVYLWKTVLGIDQLDAAANLFDRGARSLSVVHALTELRRHGHVLSVAQIYEHPSVAAQARLLAAATPQIEKSDTQRGERQRAALAGFARRRGT